jgi:transcriptional regulator with XRE-family HTH domain
MAPISNRIRHFRQAKGLKTEELAAQVGSTQATISRLEQGKQALTVEWLYRLAPVLGVRPVDLLEGSDSISYAYVIGDVRVKRPEAPLFIAEKRYPIPIPVQYAQHPDQILEAFEVGDQCWMVVGAAAFRWYGSEVGRTFIVLTSDRDGEDEGELSVRTAEQSPQGIVYTTNEGDPRTRWLLPTDPRVKRQWVVIGEWRRYMPRPNFRFITLGG